MAVFFNFKTTSNHLHSLQVENCDSNSRLVVDEDENGKSRPERVKYAKFLKCLVSNKTKKSNFHPLEVVDRGSETQLQVGGKINHLA